VEWCIRCAVAPGVEPSWPATFLDDLGVDPRADIFGVPCVVALRVDPHAGIAIDPGYKLFPRIGI